VLRNLPAHTWRHIEHPERHCPIRGAYDGNEEHWEDPNVLNFERFDQPDMADPSDTDIAILRQIFEIAASMPKGARLADLSKALAPALPSNDAERRTLIGILGFCGFLRDPAKPGHREGFPPSSAMAQGRLAVSRAVVEWSARRLHGSNLGLVSNDRTDVAARFSTLYRNVQRLAASSLPNSRRASDEPSG
jgi:hypothetical protein